jgi:hypothetical protein
MNKKNVDLRRYVIEANLRLANLKYSRFIFNNFDIFDPLNSFISSIIVYRHKYSLIKNFSFFKILNLFEDFIFSDYEYMTNQSRYYELFGENNFIKIGNNFLLSFITMNIQKNANYSIKLRKNFKKKSEMFRFDLSNFLSFFKLLFYKNYSFYKSECEMKILDKTASSPDFSYIKNIAFSKFLKKINLKVVNLMILKKILLISNKGVLENASEKIFLLFKKFLSEKGDRYFLMFAESIDKKYKIKKIKSVIYLNEMMSERSGQLREILTRIMRKFHQKAFIVEKFLKKYVIGKNKNNSNIFYKNFDCKIFNSHKLIFVLNSLKNFKETTPLMSEIFLCKSFKKHPLFFMPITNLKQLFFFFFNSWNKIISYRLLSSSRINIFSKYSIMKALFWLFEFKYKKYSKKFKNVSIIHDNLILLHDNRKIILRNFYIKFFNLFGNFNYKKEPKKIDSMKKIIYYLKTHDKAFSINWMFLSYNISNYNRSSDENRVFMVKIRNKKKSFCEYTLRLRKLLKKKAEESPESWIYDRLFFELKKKRVCKITNPNEYNLNYSNIFFQYYFYSEEKSSNVSKSFLFKKLFKKFNYHYRYKIHINSKTAFVKKFNLFLIDEKKCFGNCYSCYIFFLGKYYNIYNAGNCKNNFDKFVKIRYNIFKKKKNIFINSNWISENIFIDIIKNKNQKTLKKLLLKKNNENSYIDKFVSRKCSVFVSNNLSTTSRFEILYCLSKLENDMKLNQYLYKFLKFGHIWNLFFLFYIFRDPISEYCSHLNKIKLYEKKFNFNKFFIVTHDKKQLKASNILDLSKSIVYTECMLKYYNTEYNDIYYPLIYSVNIFAATFDRNKIFRIKRTEKFDNRIDKNVSNIFNKEYFLNYQKCCKKTNVNVYKIFVEKIFYFETDLDVNLKALRKKKVMSLEEKPFLFSSKTRNVILEKISKVPKNVIKFIKSKTDDVVWLDSSSIKIAAFLRNITGFNLFGDFFFRSIFDFFRKTKHFNLRELTFLEIFLNKKTINIIKENFFFYRFGSLSEKTENFLMKISFYKKYKFNEIDEVKKSARKKNKDFLAKYRNFIEGKTSISRFESFIWKYFSKYFVIFNNGYWRRIRKFFFFSFFNQSHDFEKMLNFISFSSENMNFLKKKENPITLYNYIRAHYCLFIGIRKSNIFFEYLKDDVESKIVDKKIIKSKINKFFVIFKKLFKYFLSYTQFNLEFINNLFLIKKINVSSRKGSIFKKVEYRSFTKSEKPLSFFLIFLIGIFNNPRQTTKQFVEITRKTILNCFMVFEFQQNFTIKFSKNPFQSKLLDTNLGVFYKLVAYGQSFFMLKIFLILTFNRKSFNSSIKNKKINISDRLTKIFKHDLKNEKSFASNIFILFLKKNKIGDLFYNFYTLNICSKNFKQKFFCFFINKLKKKIKLIPLEIFKFISTAIKSVRLSGNILTKIIEKFIPMNLSLLLHNSEELDYFKYFFNLILQISIKKTISWMSAKLDKVFIIIFLIIKNFENKQNMIKGKDILYLVKFLLLDNIAFINKSFLIKNVFISLTEKNFFYRSYSQKIILIYIVRRRSFSSDIQMTLYFLERYKNIDGVFTRLNSFYSLTTILLIMKPDQKLAGFIKKLNTCLRKKNSMSFIFNIFILKIYFLKLNLNSFRHSYINHIDLKDDISSKTVITYSIIFTNAIFYAIQAQKKFLIDVLTSGYENDNSTNIGYFKHKKKREKDYSFVNMTGIIDHFNDFFIIYLYFGKMNLQDKDISEFFVKKIFGDKITKSFKNVFYYEYKLDKSLFLYKTLIEKKRNRFYCHPFNIFVYCLFENIEIFYLYTTCKKFLALRAKNYSINYNKYNNDPDIKKKLIANVLKYIRTKHAFIKNYINKDYKYIDYKKQSEKILTPLNLDLMKIRLEEEFYLKLMTNSLKFLIIYF